MSERSPCSVMCAMQRKSVEGSNIDVTARLGLRPGAVTREQEAGVHFVAECLAGSTTGNAVGTSELNRAAVQRDPSDRRGAVGRSRSRASVPGPNRSRKIDLTCADYNNPELPALAFGRLSLWRRLAAAPHVLECVSA